MMYASDELFLIRAMNRLPSGATTVRKRLGQDHDAKHLGEGEAEGARRLGLSLATVLIPDRTVSATNAPV